MIYEWVLPTPLKIKYEMSIFFSSESKIFSNPGKSLKLLDTHRGVQDSFPL